MNEPATQPAHVMGWGKIILILIAVGLTTGLTLGLLGELFGRSFNPTAGVGAAIGSVGALLLVQRRRAAPPKA
jgi:hypothetical protein